jgi:hypothetical protein
MIEVDLEKVRERHLVIEFLDGRNECSCGKTAPCDAIKLADEIERLREALRQIASSLHCDRASREPCLCCLAHSALHTNDSPAPTRHPEPKQAENAE